MSNLSYLLTALVFSSMILQSFQTETVKSASKGVFSKEGKPYKAIQSIKNKLMKPKESKDKKPEKPQKPEEQEKHNIPQVPNQEDGAVDSQKTHTENGEKIIKPFDFELNSQNESKTKSKKLKTTKGNVIKPHDFSDDDKTISDYIPIFLKARKESNTKTSSKQHLSEEQKAEKIKEAKEFENSYKKVHQTQGDQLNKETDQSAEIQQEEEIQAKKNRDCLEAHSMMRRLLECENTTTDKISKRDCDIINSKKEEFLIRAHRFYKRCETFLREIPNNNIIF